MARWPKNLPVMHEMQEAHVQSLGWEDHPGGGHGNPLQDPCLENTMDRGDWRAIVHRVTKDHTQVK